MKGVVYTELLGMMEEKFGLEIVDRLIQACDLPSEGVYTSVGTYDFQELIAIVAQLSEEISVPVSDLVRDFGKYLFTRFTKTYPQIFAEYQSMVAWLGSVEGVIHVEVKKLYPDAELPTLEFEQQSEREWCLTYRSTRPFADLCEGLIEACGDYYGETWEIQRQDLSSPAGSLARFNMRWIEG